MRNLSNVKGILLDFENTLIKFETDWEMLREDLSAIFLNFGLIRNVFSGEETADFIGRIFGTQIRPAHEIPLPVRLTRMLQVLVPNKQRGA